MFSEYTGLLRPPRAFSTYSKPEIRVAHQHPPEEIMIRRTHHKRRSKSGQVPTAGQVKVCGRMQEANQLAKDWSGWRRLVKGATADRFLPNRT